VANRRDRSRKKRIRQLQGNQCALCEKVSILTIHHIIAVRNGGKDHHENLIGLCAPCHRLVEKDGSENWIAFFQAMKQVHRKTKILGRLCKLARRYGNASAMDLLGPHEHYIVQK